MKWKGSGDKRKYTEIKNEMMYIPILETIQSLLSDEEVLKQVSTANCTRIKTGLQLYTCMFYTNRLMGVTSQLTVSCEITVMAVLFLVILLKVWILTFYRSFYILMT